MSLKMTNATAVYTVMILILAAGLWAILSFGETLHAAPDLAGEWEFTDTATGEVTKASMNQSGRFLQLRMNGRPAEELRMSPPGDPQHSRAIELKSPARTITLTEGREPDTYRLFISPPNESMIGKMVSRTYPRAGSSTRPATHAS